MSDLIDDINLLKGPITEIYCEERPDEYLSADKEWININTMTDSHLINAYKFFTVNHYDSKLLARLKIEVEKRKL